MRGLAQRFWEKVDKSPGHGPLGDCWLWVASLRPNGYGQIGRGRSGTGMEYAHRVAFMLANGRLPLDGMEVCHRCDVRNCVNPDHLFEGTRAENLADMTAKGRRRSNPPKGSAHPNSKLTEDDVRRIRTSQFSERREAERSGVSRTLVRKIRNREVWLHV